MKYPYFFIIFFASSLISFGQNKDIETNANIKSVTVYNSSAEINYQKTVSLPQGKTTVIFTDLIPDIVANTINISASNPDIEIIMVTDKINYIKERKENNQLILIYQDSINRIVSELGLLKCKLETLSKEKDMLFKDESIGGVAKGVSVAEIEKASLFFSKRYYELSAEIYTLSQKENSLQLSLNKFRNQIKELSSNVQKSSSEIMVTVLNNSAKNVEFNFKFLTSKAGWAPMYDCKYQGPNSPLKFIFRANVYNATGIAWENIDLKLSTASPTEGFNTPALNSHYTNPSNPKVTTRDGVNFKEIEVANTIAEYDIKHKYSIPSDSKPYLIDVSEYSINASYYYLLIPKLDPFGFLMAQIPDWNKYSLISGKTNIYNKGSFMGTTFLNTYAENDTLSVYLGKDNIIQGIRKEVYAENQSGLINNYNVEKAGINLTIKNNSDEAFTVKVIDQIPVYFNDDKVKYGLQNLEQAVFNREDGELVWNFKIDKKESKVLDYKYDIRIPKSMSYSKVRKSRAVSCPSF